MIKNYDVVHETSLYVSDAAMTPGYLAVLKSSQPSGAGVGDGFNETAPVAIQPTGTPASGTVVVGVIFQEVVDIDPTTDQRNYQRCQAVVGEPVSLAKIGWLQTNGIVGTPAAGDAAYVGALGAFDTTQRNSIPAIGKFETAKDSAGFARVSFNFA